jgi:hypothetical protein
MPRLNHLTTLPPFSLGTGMQAVAEKETDRITTACITASYNKTASPTELHSESPNGSEREFHA